MTPSRAAAAAVAGVRPVEHESAGDRSLLVLVCRIKELILRRGRWLFLPLTSASRSGAAASDAYASANSVSFDEGFRSLVFSLVTGRTGCMDRSCENYLYPKTISGGS